MQSFTLGRRLDGIDAKLECAEKTFKSMRTLYSQGASCDIIAPFVDNIKSRMTVKSDEYHVEEGLDKLKNATDEVKSKFATFRASMHNLKKVAEEQSELVQQQDFLTFALKTSIQELMEYKGEFIETTYQQMFDIDSPEKEDTTEDHINMWTPDKAYKTLEESPLGLDDVREDAMRLLGDPDIEQTSYVEPVIVDEYVIEQFPEDQVKRKEKQD